MQAHVLTEDLTRQGMDFAFDEQGFINYSPVGYMFVHIMTNNRNQYAVVDLFDGDIDAIKNSATTHLSYYGRLESQGNKIISQANIYSFPNWVNTEQRRAVEFNNSQLPLSTHGVQLGNEKTDAHLAWQRVTNP